MDLRNLYRSHALEARNSGFSFQVCCTINSYLKTSLTFSVSHKPDPILVKPWALTLVSYFPCFLFPYTEGDCQNPSHALSFT